MALGWIYVLSNASMPGLLKIGQSTADPEFRALELHTTGVPQPFQVEYKGLFEDFAALERRVHSALSDQREHRSREFFRMSVQAAVQRILELSESPVCFEVWREAEAAYEADEVDEVDDGLKENWVQIERLRRKRVREHGTVSSILHINCVKCGAVVRDSQLRCDRCGTAVAVR